MLHIIHLSDLHFSERVLDEPTSETLREDSSPAESNIFRNLQVALGQTKRAYDPEGTFDWLVALTGDLFDTAQVNPDRVGEILDALWQVLRSQLQSVDGGERNKLPRVLLLPGNHDVRRKGVFKSQSHIFSILRKHIQASPELQSHVHVYGGDSSRLVEPVTAVPASFAHLAACDSTYLPYGLLGAGGLVRAQDLLSLSAGLLETSLPLVFMLHHHLIPTPVADLHPLESGWRPILGRLVANADYEEVTQTALGAGSALSTLQRLGRPVLVLHGHKHYPSVRLLSGTAPGQADVLILSAGAAGVAEEYRTGRMSPMRIWPSFNHIQMDNQRIQADVVAYPYRATATCAESLVRRPLADMTYTDRCWKTRPSACPSPTETPGPKLKRNVAIVTIQRGTQSWCCHGRKSMHVKRLLEAGAHPRLDAYDEDIDCARGAVVRMTVASSEFEVRQESMARNPEDHGDILRTAPPCVLRPSPPEVSLCVDGTTMYTVTDALYMSAQCFGRAHGLREAPFESVELVARYPSEVAHLEVRGLGAEYGLQEGEYFGSVTDLAFGIESPAKVTWSSQEDIIHLDVNDCPARQRLRIYWRLLPQRSPSLLRHFWQTLLRCSCGGCAS